MRNKNCTLLDVSSSICLSPFCMRVHIIALIHLALIFFLSFSATFHLFVDVALSIVWRKKKRVASSHGEREKMTDWLTTMNTKVNKWTISLSIRQCIRQWKKEKPNGRFFFLLNHQSDNSDDPFTYSDSLFLMCHCYRNIFCKRK
jgi:hypothetical protein